MTSWTPEFVSEFAEFIDADAAVAERRPVRVVVHNVVQDLQVVSVPRPDAPAGFVVDRVVLDRDVVGNYAIDPGVLTFMPSPSRFGFPVLYPANACDKV